MSVQGDILRKCFIKGVLFIMYTRHFYSTNEYLQMHQKWSVKAPVHVPIFLIQSGEWFKKASVGKQKDTLSAGVRHPMQSIPSMYTVQDIQHCPGSSACHPGHLCMKFFADWLGLVLDVREHDLFLQKCRFSVPVICRMKNSHWIRSIH